MSSLQVALAQEKGKAHLSEPPPRDNPKTKRRSERPRQRRGRRQQKDTSKSREAIEPGASHYFSSNDRNLDKNITKLRIDTADSRPSSSPEKTESTSSTSPSVVAAYYVMCSKEECQERERENQVSEWESTSDTVYNKPNQRRIDPTLAISKYRRSAAGVAQRRPRTTEQLQATWHHLLNLITTQQLPQKQGRGRIMFRSFANTVAFCDDRIRAMQVDFVVSQQSSRLIQLQLARYHLMELYLLQGAKVNHYEPKFTKQALWTALSGYWDAADDPTVSQRENLDGGDEQIMAWTMLSQTAAILCQRLGGDDDGSKRGWADCQTGLVGVLASAWDKQNETTRREGYVAGSHSDKGVLMWTLGVLAAVEREDWRAVLHALATSGTSSFHCLCRICMAPALPALRLGLLQQYNVAWMKRSKLDPEEMARLLYLPDAHTAKEFCQNAGIPFEDGFLMLKVAPISYPSSLNFHRTTEDDFVFNGLLVGGRNDEDGVLLPSSSLFRSIISNSSKS